jgi:hypothetical protein
MAASRQPEYRCHRLKLVDLRHSEPHRQVHLEPSNIYEDLYRISTAHNSSCRNRLFLYALPPYPEIINDSIWASTRGSKEEFNIGAI